MSQGAGFTSPGAGASPSVNNKRNQSLTPVTIKQINSAKQVNQSEFYIDDKPVSQVKIVGMILQVEIQATNTNYTVDDTSGIITVRIYTNEDTPDLNSGCREDVYVSVVGNLRELGGNRVVVAFQVNPLKNFTGIILHNLDVIHTHCKNKYGPLDEKGNQKATPMLATSNQTYGAAADEGGQDGMDKHQADVLKVFSTYSKNSEAGTSVSDVIEKLQQYDPNKIREAVDFLSSEGHLYSTIDEEHFKCTSD
eukprot:CAMPEP_0170178180 /NCGR_PEP_ID=MMETSP0040_2-20121228/11719_1 /TAXON_ID=641309 /ORGANISM="Lotharella oceanica, Strain CCMP622" /LENGTH=250 /DNA_ID=CAMNT_0010421167 /DNA_START=50 /DNA_END=802 /DNA_ORIENTATION=+